MIKGQPDELIKKKRKLKKKHICAGLLMRYCHMCVIIRISTCHFLIIKIIVSAVIAWQLYFLSVLHQTHQSFSLKQRGGEQDRSHKQQTDIRENIEEGFKNRFLIMEQYLHVSLERQCFRNLILRWTKHSLMSWSSDIETFPQFK